MPVTQKTLMRALLAGLAAAFGFMALLGGGLLGMTFGLISPLPLFFTALTAGLTSTGIATLLAFWLVSLQTPSVLSVGFFFLGMTLVPLFLAWRLENRGLRALSGKMLGRHLSTVSIVGGLVLAAGFLYLDRALAGHGGVLPTVQMYVGAFLDMLVSNGGLDARDAADLRLRVGSLSASLVALTGSVWLTVMALNAGLAARIAKGSPTFDRASMHMLMMPRWVSLLVLAFGILSLSAGRAGLAMAIVAGTLLTAAALQGLSVIHFISKNLRYRGFLLTAVYGLCLLFNPAGLLLALFGLADSRLDLRQRLGGHP